MDVKVVDNPAKRRYEAWVDGGFAGYTRYGQTRGHITFFHTEVEPDFAGAGLGRRLARGALEDVVAQGKQVMPLCPFIAGYIRDNPDLLEAVVPSVRQRLAAQAGARSKAGRS